MSGPDDEKDISPSFEEQIKFLRKSRSSNTRSQKTTEFNVNKKLKKELSKKSQELETSEIDRRLQEALNREAGKSFLGDSLADSVIEKKQPQRRATKAYYNKPSVKPPVSPGGGIEDGATSSKGLEAGGKPALPGSGIASSSFPAVPASRQENQSTSSAEPVRKKAKSFFDPQTSEYQKIQSQAPADACDDHAPEYAENNQAPEYAEEAQLQLSQEEIEAVARNEETRRYLYVYAASFKEETGLDMLLDGQTVRVFLNACGETAELYRVDCSDAGLDEVHIFVGTLIEKYIDVLQSNFGIEFAMPGEALIRQLEPNEKEELIPGDILYARAPRLDELKVLHRAIEYSWPATYQAKDELPMRVAFLNGTLIKDEYDGVLLKFLEDGRPVLFITPELCRRGVPTELDPIGNDQHESWQTSIMRELAWKSAADCNRIPVPASESGELGWLQVNVQNDSPVYALKTKKGDLFLPYEDALDRNQAWAKCNEQGELIGQNGEKLEQVLDIVYMSNHDIVASTEVQPCGDCFFSPDEEMVEALRCFRQGPEWRAHLARTSPVLYKMAKNADQLSINRCYQRKDGYAGLIRSATGALVENNSANQKEISQFEQKLARKST